MDGLVTLSIDEVNRLVLVYFHDGSKSRADEDYGLETPFQ